MFTYTGFYALNKKYITVDDFLSIPFKSRELLSDCFYNAEELYWEAQYCRDKIDQIFKNKHFDIKFFSSLSDEKRDVLLQFLNIADQIGMSFIEQGHFTMNDFLSLKTDQQSEVLDLFVKYRRSHPYNPSDRIKLLNAVMKKMSSVQTDHDKTRISNASGQDSSLRPKP